VSEGFFSVARLEERELDLAAEIVNEGFAQSFRTLLGKVPPGKLEGERVRVRFYRPKTVVVGLRDDHNVLQGVVYLSIMGTRGACGPLALRPSYDTRIAARALLTACLIDGIKAGCTAIESVTFPQSPTHFNNHFNFAEPLFPNPYVVKDVTKPGRGGRGNASYRITPMSSLDEVTKAAKIVEMDAITNQFTAGFALGADALYAIDRGLGETYLVEDGDRVLGFAICHHGPTSESFSDDELLIKHLYIHGLGKEAEVPFTTLVHHVEQVAAERGLRSVGIMVSSGRRSMLRSLLDRDYVVDQVHQHWAGQCPKRGERVRSVGNDLASIQATHFGATELR
jgi:hypothetical protein